MQKNKWMINIGAIILCLFFFSKQPFLARVMSTDEKLLMAMDHSMNSKSYTYQGTIYTNSSKNKNLSYTKVDPSEDDAFCIRMLGKKSNALKSLEISLSSFEDLEDIILCNYYEDKTSRYLITPFKAYEKIIFLKPKSKEINLNHICKVLNVKEIKVNKNVPLKVNQGTSAEVKVLTDCYKIKTDLSQILNIVKEVPHQTESFLKENVDQNVLLKIYIDEAFYIRKIEGTFKLKDVDITIELYIDYFGNRENIIIPDTENAVQIDESIGEWLFELIQ